MNLPQPTPGFSPVDYLEWESRQETRHEYMAGQVFAMVGARSAHNLVAGNVYMLLRIHLRGRQCDVFSNEIKLRIEAANCFFYPDVFVTCDERDRRPEADYYKCHACLIVEVLSDSTAAFDRGRKFACYRDLETLQEYVLVDPDRLSVEIFRRDATGHWVLYPYGPGSEIELASIDLRASIDTIYEGVQWPAKEERSSYGPPSDAATG